MREKVTTLPRQGLRLRSSPHDGETLRVLPQNSRLEIVGRSSWLEVRTEDGQLGFILEDYVQPEQGTTTQSVVEYQSNTNIILGNRPIRINRDFESAMRKIEACAADNNLQVYVTSSLRKPNQAIEGAVVEPSRMSNHLVGHAIDFNLVQGSVWFNSTKLQRYCDPSPQSYLDKDVKKFLDAIQSDERGPRLRWGGHFNPPDPVHIDDGLNLFQSAAYKAKLSELWS